MDGAREFTTKHLNGLIKRGNKDIQDLNLVEKIKYALKFPLNWRPSRLHCRWFIESYEKEDKMNPILLELAKLDFNMVQSIHQRELVQLQRWWNEIEICGGKLSFTRDRVVENYLAVSLWAFEPKLWRCREALPKFSSFITVVDDVHDIYGTVDELELFTDAVERWDVNTIENLPEYMKICFLALFNTATDIAYKILKDKGVDIIPYFRKMWTVLCKSFLVEAKWHHTGYIPTLEEYLENARTSASSHIILGIAHCVNEDVTVEALERFKSFREDLTHAPCMIMRLCNDMSTSTHELARGDVSKSLECYMHEKGVSECSARQHIWDLVRLKWKELNGQPILTSGTEKLLRSVAFNFARSAHFFYQYQDGYGKNQNGEIKDSIVSLFMEPIIF